MVVLINQVKIPIYIASGLYPLTGELYDFLEKKKRTKRSGRGSLSSRYSRSPAAGRYKSEKVQV